MLTLHLLFLLNVLFVSSPIQPNAVSILVLFLQAPQKIKKEIEIILIRNLEAKLFFVAVFKCLSKFFFYLRLGHMLAKEEDQNTKTD